MRISDWSSDVCSSDLWRRLDRRRLCRFSLGRIAVLRPGGRCQSQQDRNHRGAQEFFHHVWNPRLHSERVFAGFAGADAYGLVKVVAENLSVADLAGMRSEEHTSDIQSLLRISYAVFCLNKKITHYNYITYIIDTHT